jgi:hypothetical protein
MICRTGVTLRKAIADVAAAGICPSYGKIEYTDFARCRVHIQLNAAERAVLNFGNAMWGRPEIEGRVICHMYGIKLHLIEEFLARGRSVVIYHLLGSSGSKSMDGNAGCYKTLR